MKQIRLFVTKTSQYMYTLSEHFGITVYQLLPDWCSYTTARYLWINIREVYPSDRPITNTINQKIILINDKFEKSEKVDSVLTDIGDTGRRDHEVRIVDR